MEKLLELVRELKNKMEHESDNYTKGLLKELEDLEIRGREETIQTIKLLRTTRILRRILKI